MLCSHAIFLFYLQSLLALLCLMWDHLLGLLQQSPSLSLTFFYTVEDRAATISDQSVIEQKFPRPRSSAFLRRLSVRRSLVISLFSFHSSALCYAVSLWHALPVSGNMAIANVIKGKTFSLTAINLGFWTCWVSTLPSSTIFSHFLDCGHSYTCVSTFRKGFTQPQCFKHFLFCTFFSLCVYFLFRVLQKSK